MRHKLYWGFAALIILLIGTAGVLFIRHNLAETARLEALSDAENRGQESDSSQQQPAQRGVGSTDYKPPPLGETDDTGYWEGNTWHQKPAPKPKKRGFWSADPDTLAYRMTYGRDLKYSERVLLARHIVREYPYSEAALEARYKLKNYDENDNYRGLGIGTEAEVAYLKGMLKYHPNSTRLLTDLALSQSIDSPEEAIAFGQKSLRIDSLNRRTHNALGTAYQRLGDYKTALVHLKTGQKLSDPEESNYIEIVIDERTSLYNDYDRFTYEISMIEAGTPRYGPDPQPPVSPSADLPIFPSDDVSTPDQIVRVSCNRNVQTQ